jgi:hypothetical protein
MSACSLIKGLAPSGDSAVSQMEVLFMCFRNVAKLVVVTLFLILLGTITAEAQVSVSIGINLPVFPRLEVVPGYPVYYAPSVRANYFFYDGLYWVFNVEDGYWYSSSWYNGPWVFVEPVYVPQFILVIPYRYYRVRPRYWSGWEYDRPPHWGDHWGREWESSRRDWDRWDRSRTYAPAPLPLYQKKYERNRYPAPSQQVIIHNEQYHYQPQDEHVRQQHTVILDRESQGGAKASGKAERVISPQRQEKSQYQEKGQGPEKKAFGQEKGQGPEKKALGQERGQGAEKKAIGQEKGQGPEKKTQGQEKGQHQEKGQEKAP